MADGLHLFELDIFAQMARRNTCGKGVIHRCTRVFEYIATETEFPRGVYPDIYSIPVGGVAE